MRTAVRMMCALVMLCLAARSLPAIERVRVAQFGKAKFLLYLPLYLAMEQGLLAAEGLDVELSFAGNDDQVFATLVSNSADFAVGDPLFTAIAAERGFDAKTIGLLVQKLATFGYTNRSDVPIVTKPADLNGLRVGSFPSPSTTFTLLSALRQPLGSSGFSIVEGAHGTHLAMLTAGRIDIALDLEPAVSVAEAAGSRVVFAMTDFTDTQAITGLMTTGRLLAAKPDTARRLVRSLQRSLEIIQNDEKAAELVAAKLFPDVPAAVLSRAVARVIEHKAFPPGAEIPDELWQRSLQVRIDSGDLGAPQPTSMAVDNRFAQAAAREAALPNRDNGR